jgi:putative peptidoglycan lipid II flippase
MSDSQLFKASSIMALGTIASRVTGLIRNLMLAALLGTAILGDTYNVANTMPNILSHKLFVPLEIVIKDLLLYLDYLL